MRLLKLNGATYDIYGVLLQRFLKNLAFGK